MSHPSAPQRRSSWILPLVLAVMVALPFAEIYLLVQLGHVIGVWWTLLILVGEAMLGAWLVRREGGRAWSALNSAFASGKMPTGELADTALVLVGGVLLVMPGFITDVFGLLFLLPFTRPLARKVLAFFIARRMNRMGLSTVVIRRSDGTVIQGETIEGETVPDSPRPSAPGPENQAPSSGPVIIAGEIEEQPER
ncbi:MAG: FxsA family protein [Microlunatus sp.]